jgi:hypothetical protein
MYFLYQPEKKQQQQKTKTKQTKQEINKRSFCLAHAFL